MSTSRKSYHQEYVPVAFVRNHKEAEFFRSLLEDHDIPTVIEEIDLDVNFDALEPDIPVLVPRDQQGDAEFIIEQRDASDDEFDMNSENIKNQDEDEDDGRLHSEQNDNEIFLSPDIEEE